MNYIYIIKQQEMSTEICAKCGKQHEPEDVYYCNAREKAKQAQNKAWAQNYIRGEKLDLKAPTRAEVYTKEAGAVSKTKHDFVRATITYILGEVAKEAKRGMRSIIVPFHREFKNWDLAVIETLKLPPYSFQEAPDSDYHSSVLVSPFDSDFDWLSDHVFRSRPRNRSFHGCAIVFSHRSLPHRNRHINAEHNRGKSHHE